MSTHADRVHVAMMNLLWPRSGLGVATFHDYWSGAHTQISSRLPGIHQYFQHHLDPVAGQLFPGSAALLRRSPHHPGFFGDAEITFATAQDLAAFAAALTPLMDDEQNVFDKTISYQAPGAHVRTWVDTMSDDSPNGDLRGAEKYMLYLRRDPAISSEEFRRGIETRVAPVLAESEHVQKVRTRLVNAYDNEAVTLLAPNVSNHEDPEEQLHGCLEIAFADATARRSFGAAQESSKGAHELLSLAKDVFVMRAVRTFTVYNHGRITTAGLRTPLMAAQIEAIGATNQTGEQVRRLLLAEHPQSRA